MGREFKTFEIKSADRSPKVKLKAQNIKGNTNAAIIFTHFVSAYMLQNMKSGYILLYCWVFFFFNVIKSILVLNEICFVFFTFTVSLSSF